MEQGRVVVRHPHSGLMKCSGPMDVHILLPVALSLAFADLWKNGTMGSSGTVTV